RGIVHRDIKPANVFMCNASPRPFVKLVDFGIAKRLEDETMTATNALLGTPAYMSPEQMDGTRTIDHRSDLWALGVLAFHTLTGAVPFRGAHIVNIAHAILNEPTPRATAIRPELPPAIDAWLERALAREPADRFTSAQEMAETLAMALGDQAYLTTNRLLQSGMNPFAIPNRPPSRPGATGPVLVPAHLTQGSAALMRTSTAFDGVGATLGPSAITHSPYMSSPRLKWWVMGTAAAAVVLIGGAFRVGYGLRREAPAPEFPPLAAAPPTVTALPTAAVTPAPPTINPTGYPTTIVIAPPPTTSPVPAATPPHVVSPRPTASITTPRKPPRAGKKSGRADEDDVGF
ncbi:MAG: protein kinase, partial [Labilithrix sp.]|nr:protein kinase [Labilithrix sp.]